MNDAGGPFPAMRPGLRQKFVDIEDEFWPLYAIAKPFTMTPVERLYDLYKTVEHVVRAKVPGDIVECGVWKGGSMMMAALALKRCGDVERPLWLYDTFSGLPVPDPDRDVDLLGNPAIDRWRDNWAMGSLEEVKENLASTGYPVLNFIVGLVEDTLRPGSSTPQKIAVCRLDTDWYSSIKTELEVLWSRIVPGGFLIIDDYGHWQGARLATDEFFAENPVKLTRVDYSCRVVQKL